MVCDIKFALHSTLRGEPTMKKTYLLAGTAIFFWSTVAVTTKLLLGTHNNFQVLSVSALFAAIFLLGVNVATGNIKKLKNYKLKDYVISMLIGLPGTFFYYVFYYAGADMMLASQAFIVNYLWPIMSIVFACIILKEKMTPRKAIAVIISFLGVAIVTGSDIMHFSGNVMYGTLLCISGAICYGIFTSLNQKFHYDKRLSMMMNYVVTYILTGIINIANGDAFVPSFAEAFGFVWNGVFTMAIANTAWTIALESGKTAKISNLAYITPFVSLIWTSLILKEELNINFVLGLIAIILGIFIQLKDSHSKTLKQG